MDKIKKVNEQINAIKGNYHFKSPYHARKKMLPFNVLGFSFNNNFPVKVYTVEYRGYKKIDHYGEYTMEAVKELIESGFLTKV